MASYENMFRRQCEAPGKMMRVFSRIMMVLLVIAVTMPNINIFGSPLMRGLVIDMNVVTREIRSNRHTRPEDFAPAPNRLCTDGFVRIMESEYLAFYLWEELGTARVVDKRSGFVWGSLPEYNPGNLNATWRGIAHSLVSIEHFNESAHLTMIGGSHDTVNRRFNVDGNVLTVDMYFTVQSIGFTFTLTLSDKAITFELLDETIVEDGVFSLASVLFWPFLGATVGDEVPGYIFVPDGPGALMRFRSPMNYINVFDARVFGSDLGIDPLHQVNDLLSFRPNDFMVPEQTIHFPVFGMVHGVGQNGIFSILEHGEEYAFIRATPSGDRTDYNWVAARFTYRQIFHQPVTRAGTGVRTMQIESNNVNPRQTFYFFTGDAACYVGFARFYREYLGLENRMPDIEDIPLMIDFIMNDIEQGFFFTTTRNATHPDVVREATAHLMAYATDNLHINLKGWQRRGLSGHHMMRVHRPRRPIRTLAEDIAEMDARISFYLNPLRGTTVQIPNNRVGTTHSQSSIEVQRDNHTIWLGTRVYAKPRAALSTFERQVEALENLGIGITLDDIPGLLFSEHGRAESLTRDDVRELYTYQTRTMGLTPMYRPNVYMLPYAESFLATPVVNSQFLFQSDTVPFLQIVLSGTMPLFAPYANVSFHSPIDILRHIDYNIYPTFLLTGLENHYLMRTTLVDFHSTAYSNWRDTIVFIYTEINNVLRNVIGQEFLDRTVLEEGIVRNRYETGIILVNYTAYDFVYNGVTVAALTAMYIANVGGN